MVELSMKVKDKHLNVLRQFFFWNTFQFFVTKNFLHMQKIHKMPKMHYK